MELLILLILTYQLKKVLAILLVEFYLIEKIIKYRKSYLPKMFLADVNKYNYTQSPLDVSRGLYYILSLSKIRIRRDCNILYGNI